MGGMGVNVGRRVQCFDSRPLFRGRGQLRTGQQNGLQCGRLAGRHKVWCREVQGA